MDQFKDIIQRACSEGLFPFILASTKGTPARWHKVRIFEWASIAIPVIISTVTIVWAASAVVENQKHISDNIVKMQANDKEIMNKQHEFDLKLNTININFKNHDKNHKVPINGK